MRSVYLVLALATIIFALSVALASAHDPLCGPIKDPGVRASCRASSIRHDIAVRYELRSGNPAYDWRRLVRISYSPDASGPHSIAGNFNAWYNSPPPFRTAHHCIGSVRVSTHTGKIIRIRDRYGHVLTSKTDC